MAHAVPVRRPLGGLLERQETGRGEDLPTADDDRSIVEGRAGHEDRREELGGELPIHRDAGLAVILKACPALEDDERPVLRFADEQRRADELVDGPLDLLLTPRDEHAVEGAELAELAERPTKLRLKHDDESEEGDGKERLEEQRRKREP